MCVCQTLIVAYLLIVNNGLFSVFTGLIIYNNQPYSFVCIINLFFLFTMKLGRLHCY